MMKGQTLCDPLTGCGSAIVADVVDASGAAWLSALVIRCLDAGDTHLLAIATPERAVAIVHLYNFTHEGWR